MLRKSKLLIERKCSKNIPINKMRKETKCQIVTINKNEKRGNRIEECGGERETSSDLGIWGKNPGGENLNHAATCL